MISNNVYSYEFPVSIKRNSFNESLLGLYYFKHGKLGLIKLFRTLFKNMENFEVNQSSDPIEIHFTTPQTIMISVDGDTIKTDTPLVYKCLPQSLTILTSPS